MPWVRDSPFRSSRNNSLPVMAGYNHVMLGAGCASYRRPSVSTDRGVGDRSPPRTPLIATASVIVVPPILAPVLGVFCQSHRVEGDERGGVLSCRSADSPSPPVACRIGLSRSSEGATALSRFWRLLRGCVGGRGPSAMMVRHPGLLASPLLLASFAHSYSVRRRSSARGDGDQLMSPLPPPLT